MTSVAERGTEAVVAGRAAEAPLPQPRGRLSEALFAALAGDRPWGAGETPESPDDAQISLWALYELHHHGLQGVAPEREWDPDLLRTRRDLEMTFEADLRDRVPALDAAPDEPVAQLLELIEGYDGRSVARFVQRQATADQVRELLRHRSIYHLKEADQTSWVVPRLGAASKAALLELQFDEYGNGDPNRLHHELFRRGLRESGLSADYAHYIDDVPTATLEMNNALSMFGLHRRLRGAVLGHLAAFEATSSMPCRRLAQGMRRLGFSETLVEYYTEHIEADAVHEQLAAHTICAAFVVEHPEEWAEVLLGAYTCLDLENRYAAHVLQQWQRS